MHRPAFSYKFKIKCAGCPNDCVASVARADMSIIGTWRDNIRIDQAAVKAYADGGLNIEKDVAAGVRPGASSGTAGGFRSTTATA